ncbi:MAG: TetR/AcrR family transcriptional regulator [Eubacteriales bacterium]|nr:TetR/AcrR family transcriptional regulator [Eubacteriales bacterium]
MARKERNSEKSRKDILLAAENQFSEKGFYGARVDEIAELAKINKRMIYEYYENKETLYKSVLYEVYQRIENSEKEILKKDLEGKALIEEIIITYFDFLQNNPTFVNILSWENLNKAKYMEELPIEQVRRQTLNVFCQKITEGKQKGVFSKEIDEWQVMMSLIMICYSNFSNRYTLSRLFSKNLMDKDILEERKKHTLEMVLSYMCE